MRVSVCISLMCCVHSHRLYDPNNNEHSIFLMRTKLEKPLSRKYTREKAAKYSKETGLFVSRCDPLTLLMDFVVCVCVSSADRILPILRLLGRLPLPPLLWHFVYLMAQ